MKKLMIAVALLGLGTQVAHASKARLIALGQDKDGSLYMNDSRNFIKNASYINSMGNMAIIEWGNTGTAGSVNIDTDTAQKAEGGAFFKAGSLSYGVYLGNESDTGVLLKALAAGGPAGFAMPQSDNVLELSVAGTHNVAWGLTIGTAPTKDEQNAGGVKENKSLYTRLGVSKDNWEAYANVSVQGESDDRVNDRKYDGGGAYQVGGSYEMNGHTLFARYQTVEWDQIASSVSTKGDYVEMKLGWAHVHEYSSKARMIYEVRYDSAEANVKFASNPAKAKLMQIPLVVGFEADANSWLTLRGSISQNLHSKKEGSNVSDANFGASISPFLRGKFKLAAADDKGTVANSTDVNAGATLHFGNLSIDGVVGTGGNAGTATATNAETGTLSLDRLMTRVSATYMF